MRLTGHGLRIGICAPRQGSLHQNSHASYGFLTCEDVYTGKQRRCYDGTSSVSKVRLRGSSFLRNIEIIHQTTRRHIPQDSNLALTLRTSKLALRNEMSSCPWRTAQLGPRLPLFQVSRPHSVKHTYIHTRTSDRPGAEISA
jgi:hypothetical protein